MSSNCIYFITNTESGKRYVGSTMNYSSRISKHKSLLRKNKHHSFLLQRAWNKYGEENFIFKIIEYVDDINELKEKEQEYLSSEVFEYNIEKFVNKGMLGKKHTIKAKITIGLKNKDKYLGENNPNYGKKGELHHNYGKKMPQNGKCGIDHPNYGKVSINRKEVVQLDIDGIVINTFLSFKEASEKLNICKTSISGCCNNNSKYKTVKGYTFKYLNKTNKID